MITCPICERRFDERAYQLVVSGLGSFDSIDCLEAALRKEAREKRGLAADLLDAASSRGERASDRAEPVRTDSKNHPNR